MLALDTERSAIDAVSPPTRTVDVERNWFWLRRMLTTPLIFEIVSMELSEYGSLDRTAKTIADFPLEPRKGFMLLNICCCSAMLSLEKEEKGIASPEG